MQPNYGIEMRLDVPVPARDGVALSADTAHRERRDRSIVNALVGHRERSAATLAIS
jgi:hypothetical protein